MSVVPLYDAFSEDYDRFVNWEARLALELPFFRTLFHTHNVSRILDVACGTGWHAIAFAKEGYQVTATDLSSAMVERARANAAQASVEVEIRQLGFGELAGAVHGLYDAITCLGNSLPHLTNEEKLLTALHDMHVVLQPGGILIIQNRNFDRVLERRERFVSPEVYREGEQEWIFLRFYDFLEDELLRFNMIRLYRRARNPWSAHIEATELKAWPYVTLRDALTAVGLEITHVYGSYRGEPFSPSESGDLIIIAKNPRSGLDVNRPS